MTPEEIIAANGPYPPAPTEERRWIGASSIPTVYEAFTAYVALLPGGECVDIPERSILRPGTLPRVATTDIKPREPDDATPITAADLDEIDYLAARSPTHDGLDDYAHDRARTLLPRLAAAYRDASAALTALGHADDGKTLATRIQEAREETMAHLHAAREDLRLTADALQREIERVTVLQEDLARARDENDRLRRDLDREREAHAATREELARLHDVLSGRRTIEGDR